jgi:hypothetical protein
MQSLPQDIEHTKTKVKTPQTNGTCERFHKTINDEFCSIDHLTAHGKKREGSLSQSGAYALQESPIIILSDFLLSTPARNALILYLGWQFMPL